MVALTMLANARCNRPAGWLLALLPFLAAPAAFPATTYTVTIEGMAYTPAALHVRSGDKVVWMNKDPYPHTVTAKGLDSGVIGPGQRWTYTASRAGRWEYQCTFHPTMKGMLEVQ